MGDKPCKIQGLGTSIKFLGIHWPGTYYTSPPKSKTNYCILYPYHKERNRAPLDHLCSWGHTSHTYEDCSGLQTRWHEKLSAISGFWSRKGPWQQVQASSPAAWATGSSRPVVLEMSLVENTVWSSWMALLWESVLAPVTQEQAHDFCSRAWCIFWKMDLGMEEMKCQMITHLELPIAIWVLLDLVKVTVPTTEVSWALSSANAT